jgi:hypothetical protein
MKRLIASAALGLALLIVPGRAWANGPNLSYYIATFNSTDAGIIFIWVTTTSPVPNPFCPPLNPNHRAYIITSTSPFSGIEVGLLSSPHAACTSANMTRALATYSATYGPNPVTLPTHSTISVTGSNGNYTVTRQ